jgi:hypothetical protein
LKQYFKIVSAQWEHLVLTVFTAYPLYKGHKMKAYTKDYVSAGEKKFPELFNWFGGGITIWKWTLKDILSRFRIGFYQSIIKISLNLWSTCNFSANGPPCEELFSIWDLRFSQMWLLRQQTSGMSYHAVWKIGTNILEDRSISKLCLKMELSGP